MNELSLFSGAGGGLLGTKLLGFRPIGYVELEPYCQEVLAQRIRDGLLEEAPIFGDIRQFVESGAARQYRGFADVVTAGFPCQPFSNAGKQLAEDDPRNMWPATADVLRIVRPRYALLENVPGLLGTGYCERIFADLAAMGLDAQWGVFSAAECGAPHLRERLFILANAERDGRKGKRDGGGARKANGTQQGRPPAGGGHEALSAEPARLAEHGGQVYAWAGPAGLDCGGGEKWWATEPKLGRVADGVAHRLERLKALGNGQVPATVVRAWRELSRGMT